MKKKIPKLTKKQQSASKTESTTTQPVTAEDILEQGSLDEESGDRWLGSDVSKALRFYQKAYLSYQQCIRLSSTSNPDAYYNLCRLTLEVYLLFKNNDGLDVETLENVDEVIFAQDSVVQELSQIYDLHFKCLEILQPLGDLSSDLVFNTIAVCVEALESDQSKNGGASYEEICAVFSKAWVLLEMLVQRQVSELENFVEELAKITDTRPQGSDTDTNNSAPQSGQKEEEYESEETTQPVDLYETIVLGHRLVQALYESSDRDQVENSRNLSSSCLELMNGVTRVLTQSFSAQATDKNSMLENISEEQLSSLAISHTSLAVLSQNDVSRAVEMWQSSPIANTAEKYMVASDNVQTLLERNEVGLDKLIILGPQEPQDAGKQLFWQALKFQNATLQSAEAQLSETLAAKRKAPSGVELGIGSIIVQIAGLKIARADINFQMSRIPDFPNSASHASQLVQNVKILLKAAANLANTSGGLRERQTEKINRDTKLSEAIFRLCLIEGKSSIDELDQIMTRPRWIKQVPEIRNLGYYDSLIAHLPAE
ncbi:uncharacterized protein LODBEIA_P42550 [Lodderomyces beijingensis]|uniref:Uncharacterized protein n=1 Tax=Lodderomyces beijingensis TaxID=1775926 RepID=A0ABP0ZPF0_9ASCO